MNIRNVVFQGSAASFPACPKPEVPEVALIGRSNVGKSSLVNLITRQKGLARVSATPGKTQLINFFSINRQWMLVDLPGYGYARVERAKRDLFGTLIIDYLLNRPNLRLTFVLIDSRLEPQTIDLDFLKWLTDNGVPYGLIFTKIDKLKPGAVRKNVDAFLARAREFSIVDDRPVLLSSSQTGAGRTEILRVIQEELEAQV